MDKNYIDTVTETVFNSPLWVQQAVFLDLKSHIQKQLGDTPAPLNEEDIYSAYIPELTFKGKQELENKTHGLEANLYKCFTGIQEGKRIVDITLNNFWTLEETSNYISTGIENEYIKPPENPTMHAAILYIGSKIRLGEYIKRLKKIDTVQLDDVLRKQKQHNEKHPDAKKLIGEVLTEMGYVANKDIDTILALKKDSKRRCLVQSTQHAKLNKSVDYPELMLKINKLTQENNLLKDKLRAIFNLKNKK